MKKIFVLSINDFRSIFRDKVLLILFLLPLIMVALIRFALPHLLITYSDLEPFYPIFVGIICALTAITPAYIVSFIMLDEKDENLFQVIRILPIPALHFILYRLFFVQFFSFAASLLVIAASNLTFPIDTVILLSILASLIAPMVTLLIISFAKNKIEGVTFLKGVNFLILLPLLDYFTDLAGGYLWGFIPSFWVINAFAEAANSASHMKYLLPGMLINLTLILLLYKAFKDNVFLK